MEDPFKIGCWRFGKFFALLQGAEGCFARVVAKKASFPRRRAFAAVLPKGRAGDESSQRVAAHGTWFFFRPARAYAT
jgi:hypothetical protein